MGTHATNDDAQLPRSIEGEPVQPEPACVIEAALLARLEPFVPQLLAIVRRGRPASLQARIQSTGVVNDALFDLIRRLRKEKPAAQLSAEDVRTLLICITKRRLSDEIRAARRDCRASHREVQTPDGHPRSIPDAQPSPVDVPLSLLRAMADSGTADLPAAAAPDLDLKVAAAAEELVDWLESWGDELRSVHPAAIHILELSFRGRSNQHIAEEIGLGVRRVQMIKQTLCELLEAKLVRGEHTHAAREPHAPPA
jgi:hypothetical protein